MELEGLPLHRVAVEVPGVGRPAALQDRGDSREPA